MPLPQLDLTTLDHQTQPLEHYTGQVLLIVNVASRCGFTNQYQGLQALYERFAPKRFSVLGFPCNQFGGQEPGDDATVAQFCETHYHVTFPMFSKIEVNGPNTHPLYQWLKSAKPGVLGTEGIKWNFTKFLVDRNGKVIARFGPSVKPEKIEKYIASLL